MSMKNPFDEDQRTRREIGLVGRRVLTRVVILCLLLATPLRAQSMIWEWDGISSPYWSLSTNWLPNDVPDSLNETATIGVAGTYTVDLNMSPTIQHLQITNPSATLKIQGNRMLTVTEWNGVTNYGKIHADYGTSIIGNFINHGTYLNYNSTNSIVGPVTNEAVSPKGILVQGPSTLQLHGPTVTNNGTIQVNHNSYNGMTPTELRFMGHTVLDGMGEVFMERYSRLTTAAGVALTQGADHTIRGDGYLRAMLVNEGTVRADDPILSLTLDGEDKTNNGTFEAAAGCKLELHGTFGVTQGSEGRILADGGTVNFKSLSTTTPLTITGGSLQTLNGGIIRTDSSDTKMVNVTVSGALDVGYGTSLLVAGDGITNSGTIRVNPTAIATYTHFVFVDDSELSGAGELILGKAFYARLFVNPGFVGTNGVNHTIRGNGLIRGSFVNNGTISPGLSIGLIDSLSPTALTQGATGVIEIDVAGTGTSDYDRMTGPTTYVLGGTLRVSVVSPYVPQVGHSYTIISGGSVSGTFAAIDGPPPGPGLDWAVSYSSNSVVLSVVPCALEITSHPQAQTVCDGTMVELSVNATGATGYQWRLGGEAIESATGPSYQIPYALPAHSGNYDVVVTNSCGSLVSANAALTVLQGGSGDPSGDGIINGRDIQYFVSAILAADPVNQSYCAVDLNDNGIADPGDVDAFIYFLLNP